MRFQAAIWARINRARLLNPDNEMPTFLFWNIARRQVSDLISQLAHAHSADLVILAESDIPSTELLLALNRESPLYQLPFGACERIQVFTRFHAGFLVPFYEDDYVSIRKLNLPETPELLLVMAHLPSGLYQNPGSRSDACVELAKLIVSQEQRAGHDRTIVIGDLNINPFEPGMISAVALNAVMTKALAASTTRTVKKKSYPLFYNPMWSLFGDGNGGPGGTYYYGRAEYEAHFWHLFDQVLLRPSVVEGFSNDELKILTSIEGISLLNQRGQPDKSVGSDHLPILFSLDSWEDASNA
jgi:hypothetical protein